MLWQFKVYRLNEWQRFKTFSNFTKCLNDEIYAFHNSRVSLWCILYLSPPVPYFWHQKDNLIPAPMTVGFPLMHFIFCSKVERMFLLPFLISDIRKEDLISAPMTDRVSMRCVLFLVPNMASQCRTPSRECLNLCVLQDCMICRIGV